jgi:D-alanyl-D-alanine carboxypeptidase
MIFPNIAYASEFYIPFGTVESNAELEQAFDTALMVDCNTNTILFEKVPNQAFTPSGSAVTLMTAYVALSKADWQQEVSVDTAVSELPENVRKFGLSEGETWNIKDLIAGMLLYGGQDAALVLCNYIAGTNDMFVTLMNQYANEMGLSNTKYTNALGSYDANQITTASDLMLLCQVVLKNDILREILSQSTYTTTNGTTIPNRMDIMNPNHSTYDERIKGIGGGSTSSAGTNTLLYATDGVQQRIFIGYTIIDDQQAGATNAKALLDYFWDAYTSVDVSTIVKELLLDKQVVLSDGTIINPQAVEMAYTVLAEKGIAQNLTASSADYSLGEFPALPTRPEVGVDIGSVMLKFQDNDVINIPLIAGVVEPAQTPAQTENIKAEESEDTEEIPFYTTEDWEEARDQPTFIDRYGFILIVCAAILLAVLVLASARVFRKKKHL